MAVVPSSSASSFSLSHFISPITPNETQFQFPYTRKTHISFPLFTPSISLQTLKTPNHGTLMGTYNVQVVVEDHEPEDRILSRFKKEVGKAGIIQECRRRMHFETKREEKKRKTREAARKNRKKKRGDLSAFCFVYIFGKSQVSSMTNYKIPPLPSYRELRRPWSRSLQPDNQKTAKKQTYEFEDDNWDLPEDGLPF